MDKHDKNGGPNHLRAWREYRQLSQARLAEIAGTSANMIQYLETGERGLSAKWLRLLASALDTAPGTLLDRLPGDVHFDPETFARVTHIYDQIPLDRREQALRILRTFIEEEAAP